MHETAEEVTLHNSRIADSTRERLNDEREIADIIDRLVRASQVPPPAVDDDAPSFADDSIRPQDALNREVKRRTEVVEIFPNPGPAPAHHLRPDRGP